VGLEQTDPERSVLLAMWDEGFIRRLAAVLAAQVTKLVIELIQKSPEMRVAPRLLSVPQAADYLGRSEQSIQHLIFRREIPVVRCGRRVHLDKVELDRWIERNKV